MSPRKKKVDPQEYLSVVKPDFYFTLQKMIQDSGVHFVDLNSGKIIKGLVNVNTVGMLLNLPKVEEPKGNTSKYLLPPKQPQKIFNIEATLNIYEPPDASLPVSITVQVVNQNQLEIWVKIFTEIGKEFVDTDQFGNKKPYAFFRLIPLADPDPSDPDSAIEAILGNIQNYRAEDEKDGLNLSITQPYYSPLDPENEDKI